MTFKEILDRAVSEADWGEGIPFIIEETEALDSAEEIRDKVTGRTRWGIHHEVVYRHDGRYWLVKYEAPATENQEWDKEYYACYEVQQVKKTVFDYVPIPKAGL